MILKSIADLIEQDLLFGHNQYELVYLCTIIHDTVLIFYFDKESMFAMQLSSNQAVPNPGRFASVLLILAPALQWTWTNHPRALCMSFTSYLFIITFMVDCLFIRSHHGITAFPDTWVSFHLFRNECSSVPQRMRLLIPVISASIVSGSLIVSSTPSENISKPSTIL